MSQTWTSGGRSGVYWETVLRRMSSWEGSGAGGIDTKWQELAKKAVVMKQRQFLSQLRMVEG